MPYKDKDKQRKAQREWAAKRRIRNLADGLCGYCNEPRMFGYTRCKVCNDRHTANNNKNRKKLSQQRIEKGLCTNCGRRLIDGGRLCLVCIDKSTKSRRMFYGNY